MSQQSSQSPAYIKRICSNIGRAIDFQNVQCHYLIQNVNHGLSLVLLRIVSELLFLVCCLEQL